MVGFDLSESVVVGVVTEALRPWATWNSEPEILDGSCPKRLWLKNDEMRDENLDY